MNRFEETLQAIRPIETSWIEAAREMNFGDFEGLTCDEIALRCPALYRLAQNHAALNRLT